jgi:hypothetical protein
VDLYVDPADRDTTLALGNARHGRSHGRGLPCREEPGAGSPGCGGAAGCSVIHPVEPVRGGLLLSTRRPDGRGVVR